MVTAPVSTNSLHQELVQYFQQRRADVQQLGQDLKTGDLAGAQQEYQAIQNLAQNGPFKNGDAFIRSDRQQDFSAVGQALQSGDLTAAAQAFTALEHSFAPKPVSAAPPQPVVEPNSTAVPSPATTTPPAASGPEIVLNLGNVPAGEQITIGLTNAGNGTEQVSISVANAQNQSPEQITLNLNQNSNQQIVLNLFNSTAAPPAQSGGVSVSA